MPSPLNHRLEVHERKDRDSEFFGFLELGAGIGTNDQVVQLRGNTGTNDSPVLFDDFMDSIARLRFE